MTRRPTTKAGIIASVGGLLVVVGTTAQAGWLFVLAAGILGLVASGLLTWHRLGAAAVVRSVPERVCVGDAVPVEMAVRNPSSRRLPMMRVEDAFAPFGGLALACESIAPGSSATISLRPTALRRGVFDGGEVTLRTAAPFGLLATRRTLRLSSRVIVHPAPTDVTGVALPETPARTADETLAVARAGNGDIFAGVREYRPGDQRRWIHWRTTARSGRLAVREHEEPARSPIVVVVAGLGADLAAERVASVAASIALYALERGRPVHCVGAGRFGDYVDDATPQQALDWAAALEPSDSTPELAVTDALGRWGRRCSFVLVEGEPGFAAGAGELARRHGAGVQVVCAVAPDEAAAGPA